MTLAPVATPARQRPAPSAASRSVLVGARLHEIAALAALLLLTVFLATTASATMTAPIQPTVSVADGAVLDGPPGEITLSFPSPIDAHTLGVTLVHDSGHGILLPAPSTTGRTVVQTMPTPMVRGAYRLEWSGHTTDGQVVSGAVGFTVKKGLVWPVDGPAPVPTTTVTTRPVPVVPASPGATVGATVGATSATGVAAASPDGSTTVAGGPTSTQSGSSWGLWIGVGIAAVVVAVGALVLRGLRGARGGAS